MDDLVGSRNCIAQHDGLAHHARVRFRRRTVFAVAGFRREFQNGLDSDAAGDLAGVIATHPVRQHEQTRIEVAADRIFIVIANPTRIGQFSGGQFLSQIHRRCQLAKFLAQSRSAIAMSRPLAIPVCRESSPWPCRIIFSTQCGQIIAQACARVYAVSCKYLVHQLRDRVGPERCRAGE